MHKLRLEHREDQVCVAFDDPQLSRLNPVLRAGEVAACRGAEFRGGVEFAVWVAATCLTVCMISGSAMHLFSTLVLALLSYLAFTKLRHRRSIAQLQRAVGECEVFPGRQS